MAIMRIFVIEDSGAVRQIPVARMTRLWQGTEQAPEFAGRTVKFLSVFAEVAGRRVGRVTGLQATRIRFTRDGRLDSARQMARPVEHLNAEHRATQLRTLGGNIRDLTQRIVRRRHAQESRFMPTLAELQAVKKLLRDRSETETVSPS